TRDRVPPAGLICQEKDHGLAQRRTTRVSSRVPPATSAPRVTSATGAPRIVSAPRSPFPVTTRVVAVALRGGGVEGTDSGLSGRAGSRCCCAGEGSVVPACSRDVLVDPGAE